MQPARASLGVGPSVTWPAAARAIHARAALPDLAWVGALGSRTSIVSRGPRQPGQALTATQKLEWPPALGDRAAARSVYAPPLWQVRRVVLSNEHGDLVYQVTNEREADQTRLVRRERSRWRTSISFRDTKPSAGLAACQCWDEQSLVWHVPLELLAFLVPKRARRDLQETGGRSRRRRRGEVLRGGQASPQPLRAAPPERRGEWPQKSYNLIVT